MEAHGHTEQLSGAQGMAWLAKRETLRVSKLWTQTVLAPVVSSLLFILVFGLSLSGRVRNVSGVEYDQFIVPGLIAMAMVQAAFSNNSSTMFQARFDRYINDILSSPMHPWQMTIGFVVGGIYRGLLIGVGLLALAIVLTGISIAHPAALIAVMALCLVLFAAFGTVVGIYAQSWDSSSFIANIVILPLAFVGGTFYSVELLPSPWEELSHFNPIFYMVQAMRFGLLGESDVSIWLSLGVTAALAVPAYVWAQWLFTTGRKLKA
ncbi:MAG: ABC transporter permease [Actinomycetota bacterium]